MFEKYFQNIHKICNIRLQRQKDVKSYLFIKWCSFYILYAKGCNTLSLLALKCIVFMLCRGHFISYIFNIFFIISNQVHQTRSYMIAFISCHLRNHWGVNQRTAKIVTKYMNYITWGTVLTSSVCASLPSARGSNSAVGGALYIL